MARLSMKEFIKRNRDKITRAIIALHPELKELISFNDDERRVMVKNEPTLQKWAKSQGVVFA